MMWSALYWYRRFAGLRAEHRDLRDAYDNLVVAHRDSLAQIADLEAHVELMTSDNHDLEREVAALTSGLRWFAEGSEK